MGNMVKIPEEEIQDKDFIKLRRKYFEDITSAKAMSAISIISFCLIASRKVLAAIVKTDFILK